MANQYGQIVGDFASKNKLSGSVVPLGQIGGNIDRAAVAYEKNYRILDNKPSINGEELLDDKTSEDLHIVACKTTAEWEVLVDLVPVSGEICVYSDGAEDASGDPVPTFKIGDGETLLSDLPFVSATDLGIYEWARQPEKPTYTYDEVGAVGAENELHINEIDRMFQTVFG